jgi:Leucine-rich repeat (LRR) protein
MKMRPEEFKPIYYNWSQVMQDDKEGKHEEKDKDTLHIPTKTTHASCNGVKGVHHLGKLPPNLISLECASCPDLEELPQEWPNSFRILDCRNSTKIRELPSKLPPQLEKLLCSGCHISSMPPLPESLIELDCDFKDLQNLVTSRRKVKETLQEMNAKIADYGRKFATII